MEDFTSFCRAVSPSPIFCGRRYDRDNPVPATQNDVGACRTRPHAPTGKRKQPTQFTVQYADANQLLGRFGTDVTTSGSAQANVIIKLEARTCAPTSEIQLASSRLLVLALRRLAWQAKLLQKLLGLRLALRVHGSLITLLDMALGAAEACNQTGDRIFRSMGPHVKQSGDRAV